MMMTLNGVASLGEMAAVATRCFVSEPGVAPGFALRGLGSPTGGYKTE